MTQVTDEMVEAARLVMIDMRRDPTAKERLRSALEAALAVRAVRSGTPYKVAFELRNVASDIPYHSTIAHDAADLIERQAEEIAVQRDKIANRDRLYAEAYKVIVTLTAERVELIEALRPFAEESNRPEWSDEHPDTLIASYTDLYFRDLARARALLERLGAKWVE